MQFNVKTTSDEQFLYNLINLIDSQKKTKVCQTEMDLLVQLILLPKKYEYSRFSPGARTFLCNKLNVSRPNLNSRIYMLLQKGYIFRDEDSVLYVKKFFLEALNKFKNNEYQITFKFEDTSSQIAVSGSSTNS